MAGSDDELTRLVYDQPDDDGPRLIYADWLLERGDPRGEFIMLQFKRERAGLSPDEQMREQQLLADHGRAWIGPLAEVVDCDTMVFRKGFLSGCRAAFESDSQRRDLLADPQWATVEKLASDAETLLHPSLRSLWSIGPVEPSVLLNLDPMVRIRELKLAVPTGELVGLRAIQPHQPTFSDLRRIELLHEDLYGPRGAELDPGEYDQLLGSRMVHVLESALIRKRLFLPYRRWIDFTELRPDVAQWAEFCRSLTWTREISLVPYRGWSFSFRRDDDGGWILAIDWNTMSATADPKALELALLRAKGHEFSRVEARIFGVVREHHLRIFREALDRFPRVVFPNVAI